MQEHVLKCKCGGHLVFVVLGIMSAGAAHAAINTEYTCIRRYMMEPTSSSKLGTKDNHQ